MKQIDLTEDIRSLSEFRANTSSLIQQVKNTRRPLVITQHGKSSAVVLDVREYEALMDKIELLQDIQTAQLQLDAGMGTSHTEAKKQVLSRISNKG